MDSEEDQMIVGRRKEIERKTGKQKANILGNTTAFAFVLNHLLWIFLSFTWENASNTQFLVPTSLLQNHPNKFNKLSSEANCKIRKKILVSIVSQ